MKSIFIISVLTISFFITQQACKKPNNPKPVEQELITTLRIIISDSTQNREFDYRVENGFGSGSQLSVDTIRLTAGSGFTTRVLLLNEQENPPTDITTEVIAENEDHLFIWQSLPASGSGSLIFSGGSLDSAGMPFNHTGFLTSGTIGQGTLRITLKHLPTNKMALDAASAGGSTDAEAAFPVFIQ